MAVVTIFQGPSFWVSIPSISGVNFVLNLLILIFLLIKTDRHWFAGYISNHFLSWISSVSRIGIPKILAISDFLSWICCCTLTKIGIPKNLAMACRTHNLPNYIIWAVTLHGCVAKIVKVLRGPAHKSACLEWWCQVVFLLKVVINLAS